MLTAPPVSIARVRRRTVVVLVGTQMAGGVGMATGITVSSLVAAELSGSDVVAGAAQTSTVVGAAFAALPLSRLADRRGRRPALVAGYLVAAGGAVLLAAAVALRSWPLLPAALVLFGGATAAGLSARFAATDLAEPDRGARVLSMVVWAVMVGAVAGPNLAEPVERATAAAGIASQSGPFLLSALMFGLAGLLGWVGLRPDPLLVSRRYAAGSVADTAAETERPRWDSRWRHSRRHCWCGWCWCGWCWSAGADQPSAATAGRSGPQARLTLHSHDRPATVRSGMLPVSARLPAAFAGRAQSWPIENPASTSRLA
jgi:MFS family permease